jgi:hypothetical protein
VTERAAAALIDGERAGQLLAWDAAARGLGFRDAREIARLCFTRWRFERAAGRRLGERVVHGPAPSTQDADGAA